MVVFSAWLASITAFVPILSVDLLSQTARLQERSGSCPPNSPRETSSGRESCVWLPGPRSGVQGDAVIRPSLVTWKASGYDLDHTRCGGGCDAPAPSGAVFVLRGLTGDPIRQVHPLPVLTSISRSDTSGKAAAVGRSDDRLWKLAAAEGKKTTGRSTSGHARRRKRRQMRRPADIILHRPGRVVRCFAPPIWRHPPRAVWRLRDRVVGRPESDRAS